MEETSLELKHSPVIKVGEKYNYYKDNVWYQVQIHKILYDDIVIGKNLNKIGKKKFFKVDPQDLRREDMVDSGISDCFCSSSDASLQAEKSSKEGLIWEKGQIKSSEKSPDCESKKLDQSNCSSVWMEGDLCVAKWVDGVWYRARIERVLGEDCYRVFFLDYHNDATVIGTEILKDRAEVPLTFNLRIFWLLPQK